MFVKARRFKCIYINVPRAFLERFDKSIQGHYPSRSEAIRRGMGLILREVQGYEGQREADPETSPWPSAPSWRVAQ